MSGIPTSNPPNPGQLVGNRYRVDEVIGTGGMATVWRGRDTILNREIAVKVLHPHLAANSSFVNRFRLEARAAARLSHPGIVAVYDTVSTEDTEAIVMELVGGMTLAEYMNKGKAMGTRQAIDVVAGVADALEFAHGQGIVHRDIKPGNILLCTNGRVKIADFGIAKGAFDDLGEDEPTQAGTLLGTASYLSPEQVSGDPVDGRSDLYSLAVVLYQLLCNRKPFVGDSDTTIALARLHRSAIPLDQMTSTVSVPISAVVEKAMALNPDDRYRSAGEFKRALLDAESNKAAPMPQAPVAQSVPSNRSSVPKSTKSTSDRHAPYSKKPTKDLSRYAWLVAMVGLVLGAVILVIALLQESPSDLRAADPQAVPIVAEVEGIVGTPYDPEGIGTAGENDSLAPNTYDDDPISAWKSETYKERTFGTKPGVGFVVESPNNATFDHIEISSAPTGWVGEFYVLEDFPTDTPTSASVDSTPAIEATTMTSESSVDLDGESGRYVLIWITDLGPDRDGHRVDISDIKLFERTTEE